MGEEIKEMPLAEPKPVKCLLLTGALIHIDDGRHIVRIAGWVKMPAIWGEAEERRIIVQAAMSVDAARALHDDLGRALIGGSH